MLAALFRSVVNTLRGTAWPTTPATAWEKVGPFLGAALDLPASERRAYIDRACGADDVLRRELLELVAASDAGSPLDRPVATILSPLFADATPTMTAVSEAQFVLHYQLLQRIPGGGMGVIYRARDTRLQRPVALKCLPTALGADPRAKSRFLLEARAAAALDHKNVCTIHEIGETRDGQLFIAMPFYAGETLADRLVRGRLPLAEAVAIARQIAQGLAHAHERGIIHRDIKPANVMLTSEGVVKILDFGIAKLPGHGFTRTGAVVGTLPYMSPERLRRDDVDARSDIWSLGVVLYEMVAGRRPFDDPDDHATREAIAFAEPVSLNVIRPEIPEHVSRLVADALAKHPDDRPANAGAFATALDALHDQLVLGTEHPADPSAERTRMNDFTDHRTGDTAQVLPEGERRQTTIVVANLSGYAELIERCAPQDVDEVTRRLKRDAWAIAERHGGTINEFSEERIVLLFGVPVSQEDHCARATRAALDLRAMVRQWRDARPAARHLALHTAIDSGESAVQRLDGSLVRYRIAGRPVRRAAQLCAHAQTDEIMLSPEAEKAVTQQFVLTRSAPLALADGAEQIVPFMVVADAQQDRLDQMRDRADLTVFTGRDTELTAVAEAFAEAKAGRGRLITVIGDAGLGKSRLLLEFRRTIDPDSVTTLIGRCSSYGQATPYMPFVQALQQLLHLEPSQRAQWTDADVAARITQTGSDLEHFLPYYLRLLSVASDTYRAPAQATTDQPRVIIQEALVGLFVAAATHRPVVLLVEDWHWVDAGSHETLKRLVDLLPEHRLFVLMTTRSAPGADLQHGDAHRSLTLRPLGAGPSSAMLHAVLGAVDVPSELIARVHERTGGNPFFLEEIARSLIEAGTIRIDSGRAQVVGALDTLHMPATVQAVIRSRLDRLDLEVRQVLRAASVVGRDFTREILVRVVAAPEQVGQALETLTAAGIIRQTAILPEPAYTFRHALSHEAAYAGLLEHQRADLHARVGKAIEELHAGQLGDRLDRLAQHFSLAENWPKAVDYGLQAAARTEGLHQFVDALRLLERTREWATLLDPPHRHETVVEILFRQERVGDALGVRERQRLILEELVALLESLDDSRRLAEALLRKGELHTILHEFERAEAALDRSLQLRRAIGDSLGERASLRGFGFLRWSQLRYADALMYNEAALQIDRQHGRITAIIGDLHNLGSVYTLLGDLKNARACFEEALDLSAPAKGFDDPVVVDLWQPRVSVLYSYGCLLSRCGELDRALEYLGRDGEWKRFSQNPGRAGHFHTAAAYVHLKKGMVAECLEDYRAAIDITRRNHVFPQLGPALQLYGETLMTLGRDRDAREALEEAVQVFATLADRSAEALTCSLLARVHERLGNVADAQAAWERTRTLRKSAGDRQGEAEALEGLGRVARRHLPSSVALRFFEEAIALAATLDDSQRAARLRNSAGIIEWTRGRHEQALAHFEQALSLFEAHGDPAGAGQMMNSIAVSLLALGQHAAARERLEHALVHHRHTGNAQLEAHALAALGDACWGSDNTSEASSWYERSLHMRRTIGDHRGEAWMLQRLARARAANGARDDAEGLLTRAIELSTQCSDEDLMDACDKLRRTIAGGAS
jgi:serine/threonine protein kinase/tetratricopeptide (TPR) repeat protein